MIISKDKLIDRLGDKTGMEAAQVQDQLTQLINEIQESVKEGQSYEIAGFGTFSSIDGELQFTPDNVLETEINNKYAGMRPIELIGAFKESETGEMPEMTAASGKEEETWAFDQTKASAGSKENDIDDEQEADNEERSEEAPAPEPEEEPVPLEAEDPPAPPVEELEDEDPTTEPVIAGTDDEEHKIDSNDDEDLAEVTTEGSSETVETKEPTAVKASEKAAEDTSPQEDASDDQKGPAPKKSDKDPIGRFLAVAASILLLCIVGWLSYEFLLKDDTIGSDRSLNNETAQQATMPSQQDVSSQAVNNSDEEGRSADSEEEPSAGEQEEGTEEKNSELEEVSQVIKDEGSSSQSAKQAEPAQEEPYGLRGNVEESLNSWYTIVVHSLKDADKAEVNRQQLEAEGYRATIKQVQLEEAMQYRVGIGQFPSVEEALRAAGELSEPYKSNNFIKRF